MFTIVDLGEVVKYLSVFLSSSLIFYAGSKFTLYEKERARERERERGREIVHYMAFAT